MNNILAEKMIRTSRNQTRYFRSSLLIEFYTIAS